VSKIELIHGDCLEKMATIESGSVDMVLADPPYGTTACKWDSVIPFEPMWEHLKRVIKPNGAIALFGSEPFSSALRVSNIKNYKYDWVWHKNTCTGSLLAKKRPMKSHEMISVFYKKQCNYNRQMIERTKKELKRLSKKSVKTGGTEFQKAGGYTSNRYDNLYKSPIDVLRFNAVFNRSKDKNGHPTQKPVALMEYLIKTYTHEGDTVLDFTMGSGTTGVACKNLGRGFIGIELDEKYFKIAQERIKKSKQN